MPRMLVEITKDELAKLYAQARQTGVSHTELLNRLVRDRLAELKPVEEEAAPAAA